jgi:hypothetical protein
MGKGLMRIFFLLLFFALLACNRQKPGHGGILSYNEMKQVMWDMTLADEFASVYIKRDSTKDLQKETNILYQKVFVLHKTDSARFFNSFDFYKKHPEHYKILLDSLYAFANRERENRFYLNTIKAPVSNAK